MVTTERIKDYFSLIISMAVVIVVLFAFGYSFYISLYSRMEDTTLENCTAQVDIASEKMNHFLMTAKDVVDVTANTIEYMMDNGSTNEEILNYLVE